MPFYDVWEKKTVFIANAGPPPVGWPPILPPSPHPPIPPGGGLRPSNPIMLPGMPGWGIPPVQPPGPVDPGFGNPWFDPHPTQPIMLPGMPGWEGPELPPVKPPIEPPTVLPDLASPGFWTQVIYPNYTRPGFIQTSLNSSPDHQPQHPEKGIPGEWLYVLNSAVGYTYAWLPKMFDGEEEHSGKHRTKKKVDH
jgi:hypothetical protein